VITREYGCVNTKLVSTQNAWQQAAQPNSDRVALLVQRCDEAGAFSIAFGRIQPKFSPGINSFTLSWPSDGKPMTRENGRATCESGLWIYSQDAGTDYIISEIIEPEGGRG
jgi:hypothetical protein